MGERRERISTLIVGAERSGKSYLANIMAALMAEKAWSLIYNVYREDDFAEATPIEFLDFEEHKSLIPTKEGQKAYANNPAIYLFRKRDESDLYHIKDFNALAWHKMFRTGKLDLQEEERLWQACFEYMGCGLIVLDDTRQTVRHGLKKKLIQLLSRKNHTGNNSQLKQTHGYGIDVALIFHAIDKVNQEVYDYINNLILFKTLRRPEESKFKNEYLYNGLNWAYDTLKASPDYHSCHFNLRHGSKIKVVHRDKNLKSLEEKYF